MSRKNSFLIMEGGREGERSTRDYKTNEVMHTSLMRLSRFLIATTWVKLSSHEDNEH